VAKLEVNEEGVAKSVALDEEEKGPRSNINTPS